MKKINIKFKRKPLNVLRIVIMSGLAIFLAFLPIIVSQYIQRICIMLGVYLILSLSLNYMTGYMGQISLGHAAFYAIGAYTSAILCKSFGWHFLITMLCGAGMAALFGFLLGLPTMRISGTYLTITTLGFLEVIRMIALNWESLTGGALGISRIARPRFFGIELTIRNGGYYYLILTLVLLTLLISHLIVNSKIGRAIKSIREDELAAQLMGIKTYHYKLISFVLSAFFAGMVGSFYAHFMGYIDPNSFTFETSITILSIVILGGMGTIKGMLLGSVIISPLPEVLRSVAELMKKMPGWVRLDNPDQWRFVIYGIILVLMMQFKPQGLLGGQDDKPYAMPKDCSEEGDGNAVAPDKKNSKTVWGPNSCR